MPSDFNELPDFESMTVEQIEEWRNALRAVIRDLREKSRVAKDFLTDKLTLRYLAARLHMEVDGISPQEAKALLAIANRSRSGGVVSSPEGTSTELFPGKPEVEG